MALFRKNLRKKALALVVSLERVVRVLQDFDPSDWRYKSYPGWAADLAPLVEELAAVVRGHGSRGQAQNLLIDIGSIMADLLAASNPDDDGDSDLFSGEAGDYWTLRIIFREVDHLNEEL